MNIEEEKYKKYVEEREELRKERIERKLNKIYEKLLDLEERLDRKDNKERKQQIKKEQEDKIDLYEGDTISYQLGYDNAKAFDEKILTELEEWLNLEISIHDEDDTIDILYSCVLNKIQELKEKYK